MKEKSSSKHVGKTNADMLRLGENRAKIAAQKRGGYPTGYHSKQTVKVKG